MRLFVLAWLAGAIALQREAGLPEIAWGAFGVAALLAASLFRNGTLRAGVVLTAGVLCGFGYCAWRAELRLADELPFRWEGADIAVTGVVEGLPQVGEANTRFLFEVERAAPEVVPRRVALSWYPDRRVGSPPKI